MGKEKRPPNWSEEEKQFLLKNHMFMSDLEIGEKLSRTAKAVAHQRIRMRLKILNTWSDEEIKFLEDNYKTMSSKDIGKHLNRTKGSVNGRISISGLSKYKQRPLEIGEVYGRLTVGAKIHIDHGDKKFYLYVCKCTCGNLSRPAQADSIRKGSIQSCGCLNRERNKEKFRLDPGESQYNYLEATYKHSAKNRKEGICYELSREEFRIIVKQNCYWCGSEPPLKNKYYKADGTRAYNAVAEEWASQQWIRANGIDRLDNLKGYTKENSVACCEQCNRMKLDYTVKEFLSQVDRISKYQKKKIS